MILIVQILQVSHGITILGSFPVGSSVIANETLGAGRPGTYNPPIAVAALALSIHHSRPFLFTLARDKLQIIAFLLHGSEMTNLG